MGGGPREAGETGCGHYYYTLCIHIVSMVYTSCSRTTPKLRRIVSFFARAQPQSWIAERELLELAEGDGCRAALADLANISLVDISTVAQLTRLSDSALAQDDDAVHSVPRLEPGARAVV